MDCLRHAESKLRCPRPGKHSGFRTGPSSSKGASGTCRRGVQHCKLIQCCRPIQRWRFSRRRPIQYSGWTPTQYRRTSTFGCHSEQHRLHKHACCSSHHYWPSQHSSGGPSQRCCRSQQWLSHPASSAEHSRATVGGPADRAASSGNPGQTSRRPSQHWWYCSQPSQRDSSSQRNPSTRRRCVPRW